MNHRSMLARVAALSLMHTLNAIAQSADTVPTIPPHVFLERAYFSLGSPFQKDVKFEGQPAVHYFWKNTLWKALEKDESLAWAVPVSAVFQVRMSKDGVILQNGKASASEPVLTPSFHIGARWQEFYVYRPSAGNWYILAGSSVGLTHYSNGQYGCTYLGFVRDTTGNCSPQNGSAPVGAQVANTVDGDFSTTYLSMALDVRLGQQTDGFGRMRQQISGGLEFQRDPGSLFGASNELQVEQYGRNGLLGRLFGERRVGDCSSMGGVWRLQLDGSSRSRLRTTSPLYAGQVEESYMFDHSAALGLFVREHWGSDYYNIRFQETGFFWSAGVFWDVGRLDHLPGRFDHSTKPTASNVSTTMRPAKVESCSNTPKFDH